MKTYWRGKEGQFPPLDAKFFLQPFSGAISSFVPELITELPPPTNPIKVLSRTDRPNRDEWLRDVENALTQIEQGHLKKVVLARQTILELESAPDPFQVAAALEKKAEGASLFCIQFNPKTAFLGASPETLFKRENDNIVFDALAGTRKRGEELLSSEKDHREFSFVQDYLDETLTPYSLEPVTFSPIALHKTANVQHLHRRGSLKLKPGTTDETLLDSLHPTPALCGTPKKEAFDWISKTETFDRNLYGGVIGWTGQDRSEWTVAIRCCFLRGNMACIYAGTGIVQGSKPEAEWDELEAKISLYEEIFQCGL